MSLPKGPDTCVLLPALELPVGTAQATESQIKSE